MKHIVLYTLVLVTGLHMFCTEVAGQKTSIDLLPSAHQYIHNEAIVDTSLWNDTLATIVPDDPPSTIYLKEKEKKRIRRKESRRIDFQIDSLFQKTDGKSTRTVKRPGNSLLILKDFYPIIIFIHITALNR